MTLFTPVTRALSQFDDPVFIGVVWRSVAWSVACFAGLQAGATWLVHRVLELHGLLAWLADIAGVFGAALLALWLFLPAAAAIGMLYFDRIALAVEQRFYPWLPPPAGEALSVQLWDGLVVAVKVLLLNIVALALTFALPGIGLILAWPIAGYAIGRGLFVAVAMRRMPRPAAESMYHGNRLTVLAQGLVLALAAYVPLMNLLIPVVGIAAMVHLLDMMSPAASVARRGRFVNGSMK